MNHISVGARTKMTRMGVGQMRSLLIVPVLLVCIIVAAYLRTPPQAVAQFRPNQQALSNPLTGYAASARDDIASAPEATTLVWVVASWRELEPEEGEYAFDAFDEAIHLQQWRERGAKLIFRLALDIPGGQSCDIPDWLYALTRGGENYTYDGETCYSPDYSDPVFQEKHMELLQAIAQRYAQDIAFVEMGSLGQNGAWTSDSANGALGMPLVDVTGVYIWQYFTAFPENEVLAAGPYHEAVLSGGGAYLARLDDEEQSWEWINRFLFGGWDESVGTQLRARKDFGLSASVGAWLQTDLEEAFTDGYALLERRALESRASYICVRFSDAQLSDAARANMEALERQIGYRLWIRQAQWPEKVHPDYSLYVDICMANDGIAPLAQSMSVQLALLDAQGNIVHREEVEADAAEWLPGDTDMRVRITIPADMPKTEYMLAMAICDPQTQKPAVQLAMDSPQSEGWVLLGSVCVY